jgi:DNA (cytosine-5)-methyltransferase 1
MAENSKIEWTDHTADNTRAQENNSNWKGGQVRNAAQPYATQTTRHDAGVFAMPPFIAKLRGTGKANTTYDPLGTVTSAGGGNYGLVANRFLSELYSQPGPVNAPLITGNHGGSVPRSLSEAVSTITTNTPPAVISPKQWNSFIDYFYGTRQSSSLSKAVNTMTTKERAALAFSDSIDPMECYYRCLRASEIQTAMAFDPEYKVTGTVKEQVKQLGNAVTPPVPTWITNRIKKVLQ